VKFRPAWTRETGLLHEPLPANVVHCCSLTLTLGKTNKIEETKNIIVSLIKMSNPVSLTFRLLCGHMFLAECLSTISEMENFTRLELVLPSERVFHIDKGYEKKLKVLHVKGGELASIDRLTSLVELNLEGVKVSEKERWNIASLPQLRILRLGGSVIGAGGFAFLSGLIGLEELNLYGTLDIDLQYLKRLGQLRKLKLKRTRITDADLGHITNLTELIELDISKNVNKTDSGLEHLSKLTYLVRLNISRTKITYVGIEYLAHLGNLRVLDITHTWVNWSKFHKPKDHHPVLRLSAAGCFVYHDRSFVLTTKNCNTL